MTDKDTQTTDFAALINALDMLGLAKGLGTFSAHLERAAEAFATFAVEWERATALEANGLQSYLLGFSGEEVAS